MHKLNVSLTALVASLLLISCDGGSSGSEIQSKNLRLHALDNGVLLVDTLRGFGWRLGDDNSIVRFKSDIKPKGVALHSLSYDKDHFLLFRPGSHTLIQSVSPTGEPGKVQTIAAPVDQYMIVENSSLILFWLGDPAPYLGGGKAINLNQYYLYDVSSQNVTAVATRRPPVRMQIHTTPIGTQLLLINGGSALEIQDLTSIRAGKEGFVALIPLQTDSSGTAFEVASSGNQEGVFVRQEAGQEYLYLTLPPNEVTVTLVDYSSDVRAMARAGGQNWFLLGNGDLRYWSASSQSLIRSKIPELSGTPDRLLSVSKNRLLAWSSLKPEMFVVDVTANTMYSVQLESAPAELWSTDGTVFAMHGNQADLQGSSDINLTMLDTDSGEASSLAVGAFYDKHSRIDDRHELLLNTATFSVLIVDRQSHNVLQAERYFPDVSPDLQITSFALNKNYLYVMRNNSEAHYMTSMELGGENKIRYRRYLKENILEEQP